MKQLILSLSVAMVIPVLLLTGCGGDSNKTKKPPVASSSATTTSTSASSLSTSSSVASSAPSTSSATSSSSLAPSSAASSLVSSSQVSSTASSIAFTLVSNSFVSGEKIPVKYSCYGSEISTHLKWDITSDQVKSFALIVEDIDAIAIVGYPYVHWNIFNIPVDVREIAEGATLGTMPIGSVQGKNDDGISRYSGPCPPEGTGNHHYFFTLYALNQPTITVNTNRSYKRSEFEAQFASAIVQKVEITGTYQYK